MSIKRGDLVVYFPTNVGSKIVWSRAGAKSIFPMQTALVLYIDTKKENLEVLVNGDVCQTSTIGWIAHNDWRLASTCNTYL
jgi:hypothetical protein